MGGGIGMGMLIVKEILKEILKHEKRRGFIPCRSRIPLDVAREIISGVKASLGGLPIRVGLALKGGQMTGIWWVIRKK